MWLIAVFYISFSFINCHKSDRPHCLIYIPCGHFGVFYIYIPLESPHCWSPFCEPQILQTMLYEHNWTVVHWQSYTVVSHLLIVLIMYFINKISQTNRKRKVLRTEYYYILLRDNVHDIFIKFIIRDNWIYDKTNDDMPHTIPFFFKMFRVTKFELKKPPKIGFYNCNIFCF